MWCRALLLPLLLLLLAATALTLDPDRLTTCGFGSLGGDGACSAGGVAGGERCGDDAWGGDVTSGIAGACDEGGACGACGAVIRPCPSLLSSWSARSPPSVLLLCRSCFSCCSRRLSSASSAFSCSMRASIACAHCCCSLLSSASRCFTASWNATVCSMPPPSSVCACRPDAHKWEGMDWGEGEGWKGQMYLCVSARKCLCE